MVILIPLIVLIIHYFNLHCWPLFNENLSYDEKLGDEVLIRFQKSPGFSDPIWSELIILKVSLSDRFRHS